jgi:hypothetical protein
LVAGFPFVDAPIFKRPSFELERGYLFPAWEPVPGFHDRFVSPGWTFGTHGMINANIPAINMNILGSFSDL